MVGGLSFKRKERSKQVDVQWWLIELGNPWGCQHSTKYFFVYFLITSHNKADISISNTEKKFHTLGKGKDMTFQVTALIFFFPWE